MLGVGRWGPLGPAHLAAASPGGEGTDGGASAVIRTEREALIVLATAGGLGPITLGRLLAAVGSARAALELAVRGDVAAMAAAVAEEGRAAPDATWDSVVKSARDADRTLSRIRAAGVDVVTLDDGAYPPRLRAIEVPPHVLFVRGSTAALATARAVAVVGTRRPSASGRLAAARIAGAITRAGAAVVSGLAVGIDGAAHDACLAEGGTTVAVLGGGHEHLSPMAHARLANAIVERGGAVVSELAPDVVPGKGTFPRRNRVISGLAEATVVVEAGARSGALITAHWALAQGRGCFVVPGPIDRPTSAGCLSLLRETPGVAQIVAGVPQLIADLGLAGRTMHRTAGASLDAGAALNELGDVAGGVATALLDGHATVDELVAVTGLPVATVLAALTLLERRGLVADAYGRYRPMGLLATRPDRRPARAGRA